MNRALLRSSRFIRAAKKLVKRDAKAVTVLKSALEMLKKDAFAPGLRTHKLSGELADSWACSAGYDLRIVFKLVQHEKAEAILLETIGSHEEVY